MSMEANELVDVEICDLCRGNDFTLAMDASPWKLLKCINCGLVFTSPRYSDSELARLYADEYYEQADHYFKQQITPPTDDQLQMALDIYRRLVKIKSARSLDVGCGGGRLVEAFSRAGFESSGIEPSIQTVKQAKMAGRNISAQRIEYLESQAYHCVTAMHVLEHVVSPLKLLEELYRVLKLGGLCIIEVPNINSKASKQLGPKWPALHPGTHLFHFSPETLSGIMEKIGFEVLKKRKLGGAGMFSSVSEATASTKNNNTLCSSKIYSYRPSGLLKLLWKNRSALKKIPMLTSFIRWMNWELLGNGEYIQITARKPFLKFP